MSKLNKVQTYAIRWLHHEGKSSEDIASELSITQNQVEKTLEKYSDVQNDSSSIKTKTEPVGKKSTTKSQDLMIRHSSNKKTNNVSIMTKEASALNDEIKKSNQFHPKTEQNIFRPK